MQRQNAKALLAIWTAMTLISVSACTDDTATPQTNNSNNASCPAGQSRNPISNICEPTSTSNNGNNTTNNTNNGDDMGGLPDMIDIDAIPPWADDDGDTVLDRFDNCIGTSNPDQADGDADGVGDACDNCPDVSNSDQRDSDGDKVGDACEEGKYYNPDQDTDGDGVPDPKDTCPSVANPDQADDDGDRLGNACDNCPFAANYDQTDSDGNMVGDACEPVPAGQAICDRTASEFMRVDPNIYIILDRSGSMRNDNKMNQAKTALNTMADQLAAEVRFGLATYGQSGSCNAAQRLAMGSHTPAQIKGSYASIDAEGGTPTAQAIADVRTNRWYSESGDQLDAVRPKAVVLITDGATGACGSDGGHPGAVSQVTQLAAAGIKTYAVGFGSGSSESQLRDLAQAGGTMNFYRADNSNALVSVLQMIANDVISCSYVLNNPAADANKVWVKINDSYLTRDLNNGYSYDAGTKTVTVNGQACTNLRNSNPATTKVEIELGCATACVPEGEEVCDYKDNDCDGQIDEGCEACKPEICDGEDNDCDGDIDEGCPTCKLEGEMCGDSGECCRNNCESGICGPPCRPTNVSCSQNSDCCSGTCAKQPGQMLGSCISG